VSGLRLSFRGNESFYPILFVGINIFCIFAKVMTVTVITNTIIIKRDYSGVSGLMMERYFTKKFQEEGRYIVGKWWDRKVDNEIDLIVVDIIEKEAWIYELKKQGYRYKEDAFREKVDKVLEQTPELRKMTIHVGALSLEDM